MHLHIGGFTQKIGGRRGIIEGRVSCVLPGFSDHFIRFRCGPATVFRRTERNLVGLIFVENQFKTYVKSQLRHPQKSKNQRECELHPGYTL